MIVCVCNALCEQRCQEAARQPHCRSAASIYRQLGCRVRCGRCVPFMQDLFAATREPLPEAEARPGPSSD